MADLLATGKGVLDSFIATLPEELRGSATEMFGKPEAQKAIEKVGEAALMRADYSRQLDLVAQEKARADAERTAASEHKARLDKWYAEAEPLLALGKRAKEEGWSPETPLQTPKPAELPTDVIRAADLEARERVYAQYANITPRLTIRHFREFGEELDMDEIINDPRVKQLGVMGVYDAKYKDRFAEKAKQREDESRAKFEADIRADERKRLASRPLTPVGDDSPLASLDSPDKKPGSASVEDLAAEYERLVAGRAG
jgi:hypothetical protein